RPEPDRSDGNARGRVQEAQDQRRAALEAGVGNFTTEAQRTQRKEQNCFLLLSLRVLCLCGELFAPIPGAIACHLDAVTRAASLSAATRRQNAHESELLPTFRRTV